MNMDFTHISNLSPSAYARFLFEHTDADGVLRLPKNFGEENEEFDRYDQFIMSWNEDALVQLTAEFEALYAGLERIAGVYDQLAGDEESVREILGSPELFDIWHAYIRGWDLSGLDEKAVAAVEKSISLDGGEGELSEEEEQLAAQYHSAYFDAITADCRRRVGGNICAYNMVIHAKRLCRLLALGAPQIIIRHDARMLIQYMALHAFSTGVKEKWIINGYTVVDGENDFSSCVPLPASLHFDFFESARCAFREAITHFAMSEDRKQLFNKDGVFAPWEEYGFDEESLSADPDIESDRREELESVLAGLREVFRMVQDYVYSPQESVWRNMEETSGWMVEVHPSADEHSLRISTGCDAAGNGVDFDLRTNMLDMSSPDEAYYFIAYAWINERAHGIHLRLKKEAPHA